MTTARKLFENTQVELNKVQAPSLLLPDYNYFINKAISLYVNTRYNVYDANQLTSDDLRVLKATETLVPVKIEQGLYGKSNNYKNIWEVELPANYYHILNCLVTFKVKKRFDCYDEGSIWEVGATRLTSDLWPQIINNIYMRPSWRRPYFFIHNVNSEEGTNPYEDDGTILGKGTDPIITKVEDKSGLITLQLSGLAREVYSKNYEGIEDDLIERLPGHRYGNKSKVRMEIRYGTDDSVFEPIYVQVDYLKTPQFIRLTQEQIDSTVDTSQVLEFPDYVCQEITNGLVKLIMENSSDPRLQTNLAINLTIATPGQLAK